MNIFQPTQHIAVHLEDNLGEKLGSLLDCEWFVLESLKSIGTRQVEGDIGLSGCLNGERLDDACPWVVGVADGFTGVQAEGGLPSVERFVVLIYADTVEVRYDILQELKGTGELRCLPRVVYSAIVFFSPTLKPSVLLVESSSSCSPILCDSLVCVCVLFEYQVRTRASTHIKVSIAIRSSN
jgi:hypothetical protein